MIRFGLVPVTVGLALAACACASAETVSTIAGSGRSGNTDGAAATATFLLPMGLAYDGAGNLLVSDAAGQRIRTIGKDGQVRTLAGGGETAFNGAWVPGGYADGTANSARFNRPTGIAVARDGTIFVADTDNNCIRRIAAGGAVSTWIGSPAGTRVAAGARGAAQLAAPVALAFDRAQRLYALTESGDLAVVDPAGTVTLLRRFSVAWDSNPEWSLAVGEGPAGTTIFVGDGTGLYVLRGTLTSYFRNDGAKVHCLEKALRTNEHCTMPSVETVGLRNVGAPAAIAAFNDHLIAYTDVTTNSILMLNTDTGTVRRLVGSGAQDHAASSAGYRDGNAGAALVDTPAALVLAPDERLVFADAGNRRIRAFGDLDMHDALTESGLRAFAAHRPAHVVLYAGDASIWPGDAWDSTVEGLLEASLRGRAAMRSERVVPLVLGAEHGNPLASFGRAASVPAQGVDAVVLDVPAEAIARYADRSNAEPARDGGWKAAVAALFSRARRALETSHTRLIVVVRPAARMISPTEALWERLLAPAEARESERAAAVAIAATLRSAGVTVIDVGGAFSAAAAAGQGPLFAARGSELAPLGRHIVAERVAAALAATK